MKSKILNFAFALFFVFGTFVNAQAQPPIHSNGNPPTQSNAQGGASVIIQDLVAGNGNAEDANPFANGGNRMANGDQTPIKNEEENSWDIFLKGLPIQFRVWLEGLN